MFQNGAKERVAIELVYSITKELNLNYNNKYNFFGRTSGLFRFSQHQYLNEMHFRDVPGKQIH